MDDVELDFRVRPPVRRKLALGFVAGLLLGLPLTIYINRWVLREPVDLEADQERSDWQGDEQAELPVAKDSVTRTVAGTTICAFAGALIVFVVHLFHPHSSSNGTTIGWVFGMMAGVLSLPDWAIVRGTFSLFLFAGYVFAGSAVGLLLGALIDRMFEWTRKRPRSAE
jgi:hypothetical protein